MIFKPHFGTRIAARLSESNTDGLPRLLDAIHDVQSSKRGGLVHWAGSARLAATFGHPYLYRAPGDDNLLLRAIFLTSSLFPGLRYPYKTKEHAHVQLGSQTQARGNAHQATGAMLGKHVVLYAKRM